MTWALRIPYQHRDESLIDTASHCRTLGQDEARVVRELVLQAYMDGVAKSAGELLDHLEALAPGERRELLDAARKACGLPETAQVDAQRPAAYPLALRPAPATPTTELRRRENGTFYEVSLTPMRFAIGESGQPVDLNQVEADAAREHAAAESRRRQREAQQADRERDAAAQVEHERAKREQLRRELPEHLRSTA
jgi:hypothetical protein